VYHEDKRGSGSIVPNFFIFSTRWRWVVIFTLWLLTAEKVAPITSVRYLGREKSLLSPVFKQEKPNDGVIWPSPCTVYTTHLFLHHFTFILPLMPYSVYFFFFLHVRFITLLYANSSFLSAFVYIKLHSPLLSFQENNISSLPKHNRGFSLASPLLTLLNLQTSVSIMNLQLN